MASASQRYFHARDDFEEGRGDSRPTKGKKADVKSLSFRTFPRKGKHQGSKPTGNPKLISYRKPTNAVGAVNVDAEDVVKLHEPHGKTLITLSKANSSKYDVYDVDKLKPRTARNRFAAKKLEKRRQKFEVRSKETARNEILHTEDAGCLEADDGEQTYSIRQKEIADSIDIASATKHFSLDLSKFGPYRIDYTRDGRHLVLGGKRGHVASFDWLTKKLHCETNVMEGVRDVQWLHVPTMYAVAQKKWTYIYDTAGVELHCLKQMNEIKRLEFLPYHFLLVGASSTSYLHWLDVSIGQLIRSFPTRKGALDVITQNPANAIIHCGHPTGVITLWSPNQKEALVEMLAHPCPVRGLAIDHTGIYMASTGMDRKLRVWDIRAMKQLHAYKMPSGLSHVAFSQRKLLACAIGNTVQVFKDAHIGQSSSPYLMHECPGTVTDIRFTPYEDVLGVGHQNGFTSLIVPGAGEPSFDALEANPYQSTKQRQEYEVKALLDKIQPEMIALDSSEIARVDTDGLEKSLEERAKILYLKPTKIDFTPRHKMKGKGTSMRKEQRRQGVLQEKRKVRNEERKAVEDELLSQNVQHDDKKSSDPKAATSVLDRFKRKQ